MPVQQVVWPRHFADVRSAAAAWEIIPEYFFCRLIPSPTATKTQIALCPQLASAEIVK